MKFTILLCTLFIAVSANATNLYFFDIKPVQSPNGKYEAEATSPHNRAGAQERAFQDEFTITFKDVESGTNLWVWEQGKFLTFNEDGSIAGGIKMSPVVLIPTDSGYLIMRDGGDSYNVFDTNGVMQTVFNPILSTPEKEWEKHTSWTTAGYIWQVGSQQGFLTIDETEYFYLRLYWGRTFIVDISKAKLETNKNIAEKTEQHIVEKIRTLIKDFDGVYDEPCDGCGGRHLREDLKAVAFVIKKHSIREGKKLMDEMVKRSGRDSSGSSDFKRYFDLVR